MIERIPAEKRHFSDIGWLKTYWLFSFADYYDPKNIRFGPLRVFNDDVVEPGKGFPMHPHEEMEIISIVLSGEITHADTLGNYGVLRAGEVQRMSAGKGLKHSEYNKSEKPLHFYQIWIRPSVKGLVPSYEQREIRSPGTDCRLVPVVSGKGINDAVKLHADATIYRGTIESGGVIEYATEEDRNTFIYVSEGSMAVNGKTFGQGDQARVSTERNITLKTGLHSGFVLIDLPS